ncbi:TraR/DksA family transcriptional regulator [Brevundimonas sp.]|uniref:TraR/DksA family transcriptional regulator n=1 Tax=Brevundimonas sp. TaxID=1871086 RepID=UPI00273220E9|nr:TraR/DksA family transcriptional regulator [Brevundimonas sp.]MDP1912225.1 TraR/DksA family transcriptional regulator [Brevundimonas sp.]
MDERLTAGQRAMLEAELLALKRQLDARVSDHQGGMTRAEHAHEVLELDGHDAAQREGERVLDMALSDLELRELARVSQALARVRNGKYGLCSDCGADIPFDRLKAEPWAQRCIDCEAAHETEQRRMA